MEKTTWIANPVALGFSQQLRRLRHQRGISQDYLAWRTGIHSTAIGRLERGGREPRLTTILRLAQGLDVPPGALLDDLVQLVEPQTGRTPSRWTASLD